MTTAAITLGFLAFCLGACPFSLWLGRRFLNSDIRDYGDRNPGATNVFRAGGRFLGWVAVALDMGKGIPFVAAAYYVYDLPERIVLSIGMAAILGSAFSPFLHFRGGKSIAVTGGVMLATPERDLFVAAVVFLILGALLMDRAAWMVMFSVSSVTAWLIILGRSIAQVWFMLGVVLVLAYTHRHELRRGPAFTNRFSQWNRSAH
ncbi:MAG: glycerol-3-phosphate acyltransferase [Chloroflexota bacterium]